MNSPKQHVLQQIMSLMDDQMMSRFKKKGEAPAAAPDEMSVTIEAEPKDGHGAVKEPDGDETSADMLKKLAEMYGKDDDEDDLKFSPPVPTT